MIRIIIVCIVLAVGIGIIVERRQHAYDDNATPPGSLAYWVWNVAKGVNGRVSLDHGAIRLDTVSVDEHVGDLSLNHDHLRVEPGVRYHLSFSAKADRLRKIILSSNQGGFGGTWASLGQDTAMLIDREWGRHEVTLVPDVKTPHDIGFPVFQVGDKPGTVWLKDITIEKLN